MLLLTALTTTTTTITRPARPAARIVVQGTDFAADPDRAAAVREASLATGSVI